MLWLVGVAEIDVAGRVSEMMWLVGCVKLMWLLGMAEIDVAGKVSEIDVAGRGG